MAAISTYKTLSGNTEGLFNDRGSKFITYAFPISSIDAFSLQLQSVKAAHIKARHHCYAYKLGIDGTEYRANDDGEPSGTAGKPILGRLDSYGLTYAALIVVRYFGGTLLGTGGLIHAYKMAAEDALQKATIIEKDVLQRMEIRTSPAQYHIILPYFRRWNVQVIKEDITDSVYWLIEIPVNNMPLLSFFQENNPNFAISAVA